MQGKFSRKYNIYINKLARYKTLFKKTPFFDAIIHSF